MAALANPLKGDLDCGGYKVTHAALLAGDVVSFGGSELYGGGDDPTVNGPAGASIGSLYSRRYQDAQAVTHAELWFKTGIQTTDWTKVAG